MYFTKIATEVIQWDWMGPYIISSKVEQWDGMGGNKNDLAGHGSICKVKKKQYSTNVSLYFLNGSPLGSRLTT